MKLKVLVASSCAMVILGCTSPSASRIEEPVAYSPPPTCATKDQCDAIWTDAQDQIENGTGMRIRLKSDTLIETYVANSFGRLTGRVVMRPLPGGRHEISVSLACYYGTTCDTYRMTNLIYARLNSVSKIFEPKVTLPSNGVGGRYMPYYPTVKIYTQPDLKSPVSGALYTGAHVTVMERRGEFARVSPDAEPAQWVLFSEMRPGS